MIFGLAVSKGKFIDFFLFVTLFINSFVIKLKFGYLFRMIFYKLLSVQ